MAKDSKFNQIKKPNPWLYLPAVWLCRLLTIILYRLKTRQSEAFKNYRGPLLLVGNHVSYIDPVFMAVAMSTKWRINFVAASFIMKRPLMRYLFRQIGVIPTTQFVTSPQVTRSMMRLLREGACVAYYPEAERSISGMGGRVDMSTAKLLKYLKIPLAFCYLRGAYLNWPRWAPSKLYCGKCFADVDILLTADEVAEKSVEEIQAVILEAFKLNDYDWQNSLAKPYSYRKNRSANGLEKILYKCLQCQTDFSLETNGNTISCKACRKSYVVESSGFFQERFIFDGKTVEHPGHWYAIQEGLLRQEVEQGSFNYTFSGSMAAHPAADADGTESWTEQVQGNFFLNASELSFQKTGDLEVSEHFKFSEYLGLMLEHGLYVQFTNSKTVCRCYFDNPYAPSMIRQTWEITSSNT